MLIFDVFLSFLSNKLRIFLKKILNFSIELESISEEDIPEYRRLRVISSLKILDSKIKSSLSHMDTTFVEKSKIYNN